MDAFDKFYGFRAPSRAVPGSYICTLARFVHHLVRGTGGSCQVKVVHFCTRLHEVNFISADLSPVIRK